jgi:choline dehydrogenase
VFALPISFRGYYPGYAEDFTSIWTGSPGSCSRPTPTTAPGTVRLRSGDPRDTPLISFHYFTEGDDDGGQDLEAVVDGIEFARRMNRRLDGLVARELIPGPDAPAREDLRGFVRDEAWGTTPPAPARSVATTTRGRPRRRLPRARRQRLARRRRLDVPRIPGTIIASAVHMISEKASDALILEHGPTAARTG